MGWRRGLGGLWRGRGGFREVKFGFEGSVGCMLHLGVNITGIE